MILESSHVHRPEPIPGEVQSQDLEMTSLANFFLFCLNLDLFVLRCLMQEDSETLGCKHVESRWKA